MSAADLTVLAGFTCSHIKKYVSKRAYSRGVQFAMEGYVSDVLVDAHDGGFTLVGSCFASFEKKRKRKVRAELGGGPEFKLVSSSCECTAGADDCSHVAGLLHHAACVVLYLQQEAAEKENAVPCTSRKQAWGLPPTKRCIEPAQTIEETNLKKVKLGQPFESTVTAVRIDARPLELRTASADRIDRLFQRLKAVNPSMAVLRYSQPPQQQAQVQLTCSPFATQPLRLPSRFQVVWDEQAKALSDHSAITREHKQRWKALFLRTLPTDPQRVNEETMEQASSDLWFKERICRLTASNIKKVVCRQRDHHVLVETLLYKEPPTYLQALHWGRSKEPEAVAFYERVYPNRIVSKSGLCLHPELHFIAASPDRLVQDPEAEQPNGLLEVKCPIATMELPEVAAKIKKGFCLKVLDNGSIGLDKTHPYYYQVMCQMSCTGRPWCDFAVMCGGHLFVQRISFDPQFWAACVPKLRTFYMVDMLPELVHPGL